MNRVRRTLSATKSVSSGALCPHLRDDEGFTTVGMGIAMVLTLALLLSAAQIYRLQSRAAEIQEVADASALAAENVVAEYMIAVRVCDAVVLSMSLLALTTYGVGVVLLCIPGTQGVAEALFSAGSNIMKARDRFSESASNGLTRFQKALPYLSAANAASVAQANSHGSSHYLACAVLIPQTGDAIAFESGDELESVAQNVDASKDQIAEAVIEAEKSAQEVQEAKAEAFRADCGDYPQMCMEERAETLAQLSGANNPSYASVDAWSFSVALQRAERYYQARLAQEKPLSDSIEEQSNSALRSIFYDYAVKELASGYVHETADSFEAYFPKLPSNTEEMRQTSLYTQSVFPLTVGESGRSILHAWSGCPNAAGASQTGSLAQAEAGNFEECPRCHFKASDMGKVGAASASIANGFEYYYRIVADAADRYQKARAELDSQSSEVKTQSASIFDDIAAAFTQIGGERLHPTPPGAQGAVAIVADLSTPAVDAGLSTSWVSSAGTLGPRVALSAATLVEESAGEAGNVISSLLDGFREDGGAAVGAGRIVLDAWSGLLGVYTQGTEAVNGALEDVFDSVPLLSASGLGVWASGALQSVLSATGLEPADLDALKPVLVNSGRVSAADDGTFSASLLNLKSKALTVGQGDGTVFGPLIDEVQTQAESWIDEGGSLEIACIELPVGGITIPIVIELPPALTDGAHSIVQSAADGLRDLVGSIIGGRPWR